MARVRINKMTVPELVTYCKEQRQGESCPKDCALSKLGCSKFLPALWDVEEVRRGEQREDAIDMVRHLIAAYGITPNEAFYAGEGVIIDYGERGAEGAIGKQDKRVPNWLKDAIGKAGNTSAPEEAAVCAAESLTESECVWTDEPESEAATAAESAAAEPTKAPALETEKNIADVQAAARAAGMSYGRYVSMQETAARILGKAEPADAEKNEREAEAILNAGKDKTAKRRGRPPRKAAE